MNIVLTNDDGYSSESLQKLFKHLSQEHNCIIVAPHKDRSGCSHSITLREPIKVSRKEQGTYICYGTPVDCSYLAARNAFSFIPDIIISGINKGPNLGSDIIYSGTAAAAREAAARGIPSIALSVDTHDSSVPIQNILKVLRPLLSLKLKDQLTHHFININFPPGDIFPGIKITSPGKRSYLDHLDSYNASDSDSYYFIKTGSIESLNEPGSDTLALKEGFISLSLVEILPGSGEPGESLEKAIEALNE